METTQPSEAFLDAATAGLKPDRELQLEARAKLAVRLQAYREQALTNGLAPQAAEAEALRALGEPLQLAADLQRANRHRLRRRRVIRLVAQWCLPPLAIALAIIMTDWRQWRLARELSSLACDNISPSSSEPLLRRSLTLDEQLVLYGDPTQPTRLSQEKAIWERWPDNKVYLHNYAAWLLISDRELGGTQQERHATLTAELRRLQAHDLNNARFDYILAGRLLDQAVEFESRQVRRPDGQETTTRDMIIKDQAKFDEAMALVRAGLAKPEWRRYAREMIRERLAVLGEPTSLLEQIVQITVAAGMPLPDLALSLNIGRAMVCYGEQLAKEGRREEADVLLTGYRQFLTQLNADAHTLIDMLVIGVIAREAAERVPAVYNQLGDAAAAEQARVETTALAAPVRDWRAQRKQAQESEEAQASERNFKRHTSILTALIVPALGDYPSAEELEAGRRLDYVVAERAALVLLSVILLGLMFLAVLPALYFQANRACGSGAMLLLPPPTEMVVLLAAGVLLPLLAYYGVTRWLPWSRELNVITGGATWLAQVLTLGLAMIGITVMLTRRFVHRRCRELLLPVPSPLARGWWLAGWVMVALVAVVGLLPAAWIGSDTPIGLLVFRVALGAMVLFGLVRLVVGFGRLV